MHGGPGAWRGGAARAGGARASCGGCEARWGEGVRGALLIGRRPTWACVPGLEGRLIPRRGSRASVAGGGRRDRQAGPGCSEGKGDARVGAGVWGHAAAGPLGQWREATRGASRWAGRVGVTRAQAGMGRLGLLRERGCGAGRVGAVAGWAEAEQAGRSAGELGRSARRGRGWVGLGSGRTGPSARREGEEDWAGRGKKSSGPKGEGCVGWVWNQAGLGSFGFWASSRVWAPFSIFLSLLLSKSNSIKV